MARGNLRTLKHEVKEDFIENKEFGLSIWKLGRILIIKKERRKFQVKRDKKKKEAVSKKDMENRVVIETGVESPYWRGAEIRWKGKSSSDWPLETYPTESNIGSWFLGTKEKVDMMYNYQTREQNLSKTGKH